MTITRKTLELAALAAGINLTYRHTSGAYYYDDPETGREEWRPHTNIAGAAQLAVRRRFRVRVDHAAAEVVDVDGDIIALVPHNDTDEDAERAYCEAVTIGAAHEGRWIRDNGRRMREGGR